MERHDIVKTVLSLAPLPAEIVKLLIQQVPDVPDFEVNLLSDGHFLKM